MSCAWTLVLFLLCSALSVSAEAQSTGSQTVSPDGVAPQGVNPVNPDLQKLPKGVILVPGAVASASDTVTPLPESGGIANNTYTSQYFGLSYPLSPGLFEKHKGPPPSDSGYYALAFLRPSSAFKGPTRASILIGAQDLFFTLTPGKNAAELVKYEKDHLQAEYKVERAPTEVKIANHTFMRLDYMSPVAELHWSLLATQIRCHVVKFIVTSRDLNLIESLIQDMDKMKLPGEAGPTAGTGGGEFPVCIKNYATGQNIVERVDPVFGEHRFNPAPVRIIIDKEGRVRHAHFISAFPDQAKAIEDAVRQWRFKPYLRDGRPVEVETGIMFGNSSRRTPSTTAGKSAADVTN